MTTSTVSYATNVSSDATFRSWGSTWSDNLTAVGFIKTTDTGQINWTTVARPGGATTSAGYEIRKFSDDLQSTTPVYVRIDYGTGSAITNTAIWITVGFYTDGAGNMFNAYNMSERQIYIPSTLASATPYNWYFSGDTNRIAVIESATLSNNNRYFFLERIPNSSGVDTGDGVILVCGSYVSSAGYNQIITKTGALPSATHFVSTTMHSTRSTTQTTKSNLFGEKAYMSPIRVTGMGDSFPLRHVALYFATDFEAAKTTVTNWYGSSTTMFPTGTALYSGGYICLPGDSNGKTALRWE